jgi:hypothetical protein
VPTKNAPRIVKLSFVLLFSLAAVCSAKTARADVSSWFFAGGGAAAFDPAVPGKSLIGLMQLETGMGTSPVHPFVVGGLLKTMTFFGQGTDLVLAARVATRGFVLGNWGLALDAGGFERWWGPLGSSGGIGALVLGGPVGIQATAFGEIGTGDMRTFGFTLGIDLMRMTVHRTTGLGHWTNPYPTGGQ